MNQWNNSYNEYKKEEKNNCKIEKTFLIHCTIEEVKKEKNCCEKKENDKQDYCRKNND